MLKNTFYSEHINIKLLMGLGAHIGHAKIDWNTDNNAYLAGLTNNNYIIFNINKTLYYFKRSLIFMRLIGYNNGKFVIYYPGDNPFYKLMMETALDKEGLLPTKYPFIHSIVKPGFFSNWRTNYKKLVKRFFKVIFWNPYFFGGMTTQFVYKTIDRVSLKKGISANELNESRLKYDHLIRAMVTPMRIYKRMRRPHFRSFKPLFKVHKKLLNKQFSVDNSFKSGKYNILKPFYTNSRFNCLEILNKSNFIKSITRKLTSTSNHSLVTALSDYFSSRYQYFIRDINWVDKMFVSIRYNYHTPHFSFHTGASKSQVLCYFSTSYNTEEESFLKSFNGLEHKYNSLPFESFIAQSIPYNNDSTAMILRSYYKLKDNSIGDELHNFLKLHTLKNMVYWDDYKIRLQKALKLVPVLQKVAKRKKFLANLTPLQAKILKKRLFYSQLGSNKYLFQDYFKHFKGRHNQLNYNYSDSNFKQKNSDSKIYTNMSLIMNKSKYYQHRQLMNYRNNKVRTESLKMLYYNIYDMLVSIALRNTKYNNNNDDLTPYEQKYFRKFVKFILIFRYLKRIKLVPSAVFLLNSDVHESQYTDFKSLNTAVIGLADSNVQFKSLSYFIPTNDDNLVLFLYYVKMISHAFNSGRKHAFLENLTPLFLNNLTRKSNYTIPYIYQYKDKLDKKFHLLPFGSVLDKAHIKRLEEKRIEREKRQLQYKKWEQERLDKLKEKQQKRMKYKSNKVLSDAEMVNELSKIFRSNDKRSNSNFTKQQKHTRKYSFNKEFNKYK